MNGTDVCACGRPLHYASGASRRAIERIIAAVGPTLAIMAQGQTFLVPRHYVALHGVSSLTLATVARDLGFQMVCPRCRGRGECELRGGGGWHVCPRCGGSKLVVATW